MKRILMFLSVLSCSNVQATPVVIDDVEPTQSMAPFYTSLGDTTALEAHAQHVAQTFNSSQMMPATSYPVVTTELTTGNVEPHVLEHGLPHSPFFILNDDATNINWLRDHRTQLQQLHAVGFVANVSTPARMAELQALAPQLPISAVPMNAIAQALTLTHVPVLITGSQVMQ